MTKTGAPVFSHVSRPNAPVFLLGLERSGSTWLSTILDSSPDTLSYIEPFATANQLFPGFPERSCYLASSDPRLQEIIEKGFLSLYGHKYPLFHSAKEQRLGRWITNALLDLHTFAGSKIGWKRSLAATRFRELQYHVLENNLYFEKHLPAEIVFIKELRLSFKLALLHELWPAAKYIVIIRNPLSQVGSILRLISEGSLIELRCALQSFVEAIENHSRFESMRAALQMVDRNSTKERAIAYWFVNYTVLLEDLQALRCDHMLLRHEDLSSDPILWTQKIFSFLELHDNPATHRHLETSSSAQNTSSSRWNTNRNSSTLTRSSLQNIDRELRQTFDHIAPAFWPTSASPVHGYRDWLRGRIDK